MKMLVLFACLVFKVLLSLLKTNDAQMILVLS